MLLRGKIGKIKKMNNDESAHKHISELYLQYEHLKKEIKRDREELYSHTMSQITELQRQNKLLREEAKNYANMKDMLVELNRFSEAMGKYAKTSKKKK